MFALSRRWVPAVCLLCLAIPASAEDGRGLGVEQLAGIRAVEAVQVSPDGSLIAYTLDVPRSPGKDEDGQTWRELHVVASSGGASRPYVHGQVKVSRPRFSPDGRHLFYLAKRGDDEHDALWAVPLAGGESRRMLGFETTIRDYRLSPDGRRVAFIADEPESKKTEKAKEKGYDAEVFEEDWHPRRVWLADLEVFNPGPRNPAVPADDDEKEPIALEISGSAFAAEWSPDGRRLAVAVAPRPLVDDRYMQRRIHVIESANGAVVAQLANPGKLGSFAFSPDGRTIAMLTADDPNDPAAGRLKVAPASGGPLRDLLPELQGQVSDLAWKDAETLIYVADIGTRAELGRVGIGQRAESTTLVPAEPGRPVPRGLSLSVDGKQGALVVEAPDHPAEVYALRIGDSTPRRLTESNPWLKEVALARQEVIRWQARDGLDLEGILIHPLAPTLGKPAPLILMVHGGPESHDRNGWVTSYSRPGQLAAGQGYAVLYPNYRGSTGRGVAFSKLGQRDAAGREFDDLIDAVDHLVSEGVADPNRVGITGGSYGGYATAWCSTRHTDRFRAGVMFVGISNKASKGLTTEIPVEDKMVHTRFDPWTHWNFSLERSPIYYADRSRTALLIAAGRKDTRVDPSQSLQLYRALKLIGQTPVRYVRYPDEGHGNRRAASRDDYARRLMRWMNHFLLSTTRELPAWELEVDLGDEESESAEP